MGSRAESGAGVVTMAKPRTPLNQLTATIGGVNAYDMTIAQDRAALRAIALNPPVSVTEWPTKPEEQWSV